MTSGQPFTRPRRRRTALTVGACAGAALLVATTVVITLTAAGHRAATPAIPQHAVTSTSAVESPPPKAVVADPAALDACDIANKASSGTADIYDPAKMRVLGKRAAQSANIAIRDQGEQLQTAAGIADAAKGGAAELQANLAMGGIATKLSIYCLEQKLVTP